MKTTEIILPERIAVLREQPNQDIKVKNEEFCLYYENFIHPIYPWQDIYVDCKYGKNYEHCWKITEYPADVDEFKLTIKIFDECGELVVEKSTIIELYDQDINTPFNILCVGDSLTHHMVYPAQMQNRLKNVFTCGTRSYDGHVFGEGRGGWKYLEYFNNHSLAEGERGPLKWVSPFLFPVGISGKEYFGDMEYYIASQEENRSTCCFNGFEFKPIEKGQYYHKYGKLYDYDGNVVSDSVEWEFDISKYIEKNNIDKLDAVSVLLGGNDLFPWEHYEGIEQTTNTFIENTKKFIKAVKDADANIAVIINLPLPSAGQNGFANRHGCLITDKQYKNAMRVAGKAIIKEFEGVEGVYICPMSHVIDTRNGFDSTSMRENLYCDRQVEIIDDPVHPNQNGYKQVGDALAATVEMIRHKKGK